MDPCLGLVRLRCHSVAHKVFFTGVSSDTKNPTARAQLYVDDPAIVISGTQEFIDHIVAHGRTDLQNIRFPTRFPQRPTRSFSHLDWSPD